MRETALPHLDCVDCRECGDYTIPFHAGRADMNGVQTTIRERKCISCEAVYHTVEIPIEVAEDIWESEA